MPKAKDLPRSVAIHAPGQTGPGDGKRTNGKPQTARLEGPHEAQRIKRRPGATTVPPRDTLETACPTGLQSVCNRGFQGVGKERSEAAKPIAPPLRMSVRGRKPA